MLHTETVAVLRRQAFGEMNVSGQFEISRGMTLVRDFFMVLESHTETVVRPRTLEGRTIECPKNYLLTYGLSPPPALLHLLHLLSLTPFTDLSYGSES